jgi:hypothetical protein
MSRYKDLLATVDDAHDWELGQTRGWRGTRYSSTDTCRICGLRRKYFSDRQNGVDESYSFETFEGESLALREAAELEC